MSIMQFVWIFLSSCVIVSLLFFMLFISGFWGEQELVVSTTSEDTFLQENKSADVAAPASNATDPLKAQLP